MGSASTGANNVFEWLCGSVMTTEDAPAEWQGEGLAEFYRDPNSPIWGGKLSRVLVHESFHFWQILCSGYLANMVQYDWLRLLEFERTGELRAREELEASYKRQGLEVPFSTQQLVECWARYWDVHTRSPVRLIREDEIQAPAWFPHEVAQHAHSGFGYSSRAFDLLMVEGKHEAVYAAPYRWLLERCGGDSRFANVLFPILVFHAFGSPEPLVLFRHSVERALGSDRLREVLGERGQANICATWLDAWDSVIQEAVEPTRRALRLYGFTAGWDVIARGSIRTHPVYSRILERIRLLFAVGPSLEFSASSAGKDDVEDLGSYSRAMARDRRVIFAFPGLPEFRALLGEYVPPPSVRFPNYTWYERANPLEKLRAAMASEHVRVEELSFAPVIPPLKDRVRRLRQAQAAVRLGLPPTAFEERRGA